MNKNIEEIPAFPLSWPVGRPRTIRNKRESARFRQTGSQRLTILDGVRRLRPEIEKLGGRNVIVSSNVPVKSNGTPYSVQQDPEDVGVAVYFQLNNIPHVLCCDRWDRVADNLAAIASHIQAIRGQLRWGVADAQQAFAGFQALPPAGPAHWSVVLGVSKTANYASVRERWLELVRKHHPDLGGNKDQAAEINAAWDRAQQDLKNG